MPYSDNKLVWVSGKPVALLVVLTCILNIFFFYLLAGKMSNVRAVRKRQQLNNLVAMVTELARPGYTVVDFCSGTVRCCRLRMYIHQRDS